MQAQGSVATCVSWNLAHASRALLYLFPYVHSARTIRRTYLFSLVQTVGGKWRQHPTPDEHSEDKPNVLTKPPRRTQCTRVS